MKHSTQITRNFQRIIYRISREFLINFLYTPIERFTFQSYPMSTPHRHIDTKSASSFESDWNDIFNETDIQKVLEDKLIFPIKQSSPRQKKGLPHSNSPRQKKGLSHSNSPRQKKGLSHSNSPRQTLSPPKPMVTSAPSMLSLHELLLNDNSSFLKDTDTPVPTRKRKLSPDSPKTTKRGRGAPNKTYFCYSCKQKKERNAFGRRQLTKEYKGKSRCSECI